MRFAGFLGIFWVFLKVFCCVLGSSPFHLEGSQTSYAQFKKWNSGLNGSIEFEFRTDQPNALILYTDDGGTFDFFEVKLVEGALRLRYNLGGGAQIITVGRNLNDDRWHKAEIRRSGEQTSLTVDHVTVTRSSRGKEYLFGTLATNSYVYVGGLPAWYATKLGQLALPSVIFEPRYGGAIRNLIYADAVSHHPKQQEIMASKGVRVNQADVCGQQDPCQHGGICINTDSGPVCECRNVDYEGNFCEKEKAPSEATLRGHDYFYYDFAQSGGEPIVSSNDAISLYFKTRQPNGLLFYTGDGEDFLALTLRDGAVSLSINLGSGNLDTQIRPTKVRFDDNQWHKVIVHRKAQEISGATSLCHLTMTVDGIYSDRWTTAGTFTMLSSSRLYVAGIDNSALIPGLKNKANFVGCLRKVEFTADSLKLNVLDLAKSGSKLITVSGRPEWMCQAVEVADPITFTIPDAVLLLPSWEASRTGSISFKIRTNEPDGLLLYNNGAATSQGDYFAVELLAGHVYVHFDLGSGSVRVKSTTRRIDDGTWHEISINRNGRTGRVTVDGSVTDFVTPGESHQLDLEGSLYVGGVGPTLDSAAVPAAVWTATLRQGYVGCMRDLIINGEAVDLAAFARQQDSGSIRPACHTLPPQCESQPCLNGGICTEGWNRYLCDCATTGFMGPTCGKDAATLSFDGTQHFRVSLPSPSRTEAENWKLRFRSPKPSGLLLVSSSEGPVQEKAELALEAGRLRFTLGFSDRPKTWYMGHGLNDNQWHAVSISRRGSVLRITLDEEPPLQTELGIKTGILEVRSLHVGSISHRQETSVPNFVGQIQQLSFNGFQIIDMARSGQLSTPANITAKFGRKEQTVHHPVNFKSRHTYVGLPQLKAYSSVNIFFQFKTLESKGLILYNAGKGQDYIAVELVNGHIHYIVNFGDGPIRIRDSSRNSLNDNRWHSVTIGRPGPKQHTLMVDDAISTVMSQGNNENLDLNGILYLGGVRKEMYEKLPRHVQSRNGFEGCIGSMDLNGESPDITLDALVPSPLVVPGCEGGESACSQSICNRGGTCVQQWNSFTCNCDLTSFTGPSCNDESVAYEFGSGHGLVTYNYPEDRRPDSKSDILALGFITLQENALLARITSASSIDYLDLELVDGNIFAVYNMGSEDCPIGELGVKVNDGEYHVVRFTRTGTNATLQVDDYNVQTKSPTGKKLLVFNSQSQIQVGGKWNKAKNKIERPFVGVIAGLVFNRIRVLDLAAERDPRITLQGDLELLTSIPSDYKQRHPEYLQSMQRSPEKNPDDDRDDLVISGAGSGCPPTILDDECVPVYNTGSGDDLITPVYIAPTRPPKTKKVTVKPSEFYPPCDDEDCDAEGSGLDGYVTEEPVYSTERVSESTPPSSTTLHGSTTTPSATTPPRTTTTSPPTTATVTSTATTANRTAFRQRPSTTARVPPSFSYPVTRPPRTRDPGRDLDALWSKERELERERARERERERDREREREIKRAHDRISSEAAENIAMIIGIIAGALIAVILVILLVLKLRSRNARSFKMEETKTYGKAPSHSGSNAALLNAGNPQKTNPALMTTATLEKKPPPSKKNGKDIKEWYV